MFRTMPIQAVVAEESSKVIITGLNSNLRKVFDEIGFTNLFCIQ